MKDIERLEKRLWEAADQLRANSKLTASQYSMPVLGLIFLRHAYNRYLVVKEKIEAKLPSRGGRKRPVTKDDFSQQHAIYLPEEAQYDYLLSLTESEDIGTKINNSMTAIETEYTSLQGALPKTYNLFENSLLKELVRIFNDEALQKATGDVFGRIYEYFLNKFAMTGAQEGGEFFTPISLVQTIVNVIEPDHGLVCDIACGSAGMFVQTGHFIEKKGQHASKKVTFKGQEKSDLNINLARMNLAVHGLEGDVIQGNTFYEDNLDIAGKCDFIMANPPFNVDKVNADKAKNAGRLPFGMPGVNKDKEVSNGNYLWIQYFYSYLKDNGRAGFVMASSASDAGGKDKDVREKLVNTGHVDVIISIGTNFFYTRALPCTLWFFDKSKPKELQDKVLMLDARNIFRKVTRKINDFTPEQLKNITSIAWLYRGQNDRFKALVSEYLTTCKEKASDISKQLQEFGKSYNPLNKIILKYYENKCKDKSLEKGLTDTCNEHLENLKEAIDAYEKGKKELLEAIDAFVKKDGSSKQISKHFEDKLSDKIKSARKHIDHSYKTCSHTIDFAQKKLNGRKDDIWDNREIKKLSNALDEQRKDSLELLKEAVYFHMQSHWLIEKFPNNKFEDIEGLCKLVSKSDIEKNDWSLTPGRFVGVAPRVEDEGFDASERLEEIHTELAQLNEEAIELAQTIQANFEELGA